MIQIIATGKVKKVPALWYLNFLALKSIFDKFHMTAEEQRLLGDGIGNWVKKVDKTSVERKELKIIVDCLIRDKEGRYDSEKFAYKKAEIDYRKVYPEGI